jgi:nucleoside permease NupC
LLVLRFVVIFGGLFLAGLLIAWILTRQRRYLQVAWRTVQVVLVLAVAFGLFYVFERVLLVL